jgi:spermidine synthase
MCALIMFDFICAYCVACMQDAAVFVKREGNGQYDVIIVDSSDPVCHYCLYTITIVYTNITLLNQYSYTIQYDVIIVDSSDPVRYYCVYTYITRVH